CGQNAITLKIDHEGFWYPEVDKSLCISCGLCEKICPQIHSDKINKLNKENPICFAAYHRDKGVRLDSTSGGVFSALANKMYDVGGYISGAIYGKDFSVHHIVSNKREDLRKIRSSKYLQSSCEGVYKEIKRLLEEKKRVLASGTPCQMAALRLYLEKDYESLTTCDFVCRGVNSPKVFRKYLDALEERHGSRVVYVKAKDKKHGWRSLTFKAAFENGQLYYGNGIEDNFTRGYLRTGYYCRPSCLECKFKKMPRIADITIGDFWGIENVVPSFDDNLGTSLVMCNTAKGCAVFDAVKNELQIHKATVKDIEQGNPHLRVPISNPQTMRKAFFSDLENMTFPRAAAKYFPKPGRKLGHMKAKIKKTLKDARIFYQTMKFSPRAWAQFFWINFFRRNTVSKLLKMQVILPTPYCVFDIHPSAKIVVKGLVVFGLSKIRGSRLETRMRIDKGARLHCNGGFTMYAGADIQIFPGGVLTFEGGPYAGCNIHCQIIYADNIRIGRSTLISRNVTLRDYDAHYIILKGYKVKAPIIIGDHCWIGEGALISKGVTIGNGSIVAARSWVTANNIAAKTLIMGRPAIPIRENIEWEV
ncbi:MAG: Coenzyme F420 hydrogenase/dehydrogenase, beta subunit C-terminal domain, partial [Candidatus Omnitrophica bacterium]|nr:Coenzyme F420 hydrogenase/dehydrogenase, beta subunit C-terminal domain [Candidatus Omnitrophota bacterium]